MRIAVDLRMLSGGANVVNRGTGRYTQQQLREVVRLNTSHEFVLICHKSADAELILPEIRQAGSVSIARLPYAELERANGPNRPEAALLNTERLQSFVYGLQADLFHATTPYQLDELVPTSFDACTLVSTLYDLIPMVYPDHYWPAGTPFHEELQRAYTLLSKSERLIAISKSAQRDAATHLGISTDRIDIAYPLADPMFRILVADQAEASIRSLRQRLAVPEGYLLSVAHIHHTKNLGNLLAAYGQLDRETRKLYPLVIVFFLRDSDRYLLSELTNKYGVTDDIRLTGLVSDEELVGLYNRATAVVHPSRYEGYGLPVVEAMQCGAAVITTTSSSLPEVSGDAAVLVHPEDIDALSVAIRQVLNNAELRAELSARGLNNVQRFSPQQLGEHTLHAYEAAHSAHKSEPAPPTVAMWTTLPPKPCGIADHTVDFVDTLSEHTKIEFFVDDSYVPDQRFLREHVVHHHSAFERRLKQRSFLSVIYQFGVSFMHDFMYPAMQKHRGIVAIHDVICAENLHIVYSGRGREKEFVETIVKADGPQALEAYTRARGDVDKLGQVFRDHLLLGWIVDNSTAQIVHMPYAKQRLEAAYPRANAHMVPLTGIEPGTRLTPWQAKLHRQALGIGPSTFVVGTFGTVARLKRLEACIRAFAQLTHQKPDSALIISGNDDFDRAYTAELKALAETLGVARSVKFLGFAQPDELDRHMQVCDTVLNLRYPSKIQMSGTLSRAIALGKPVLFTDIPEWGHFPNTFSYKIPADETEVDRLWPALCELATNPNLRAEKSRAARQYFLATFTRERITADYLRVMAQPEIATDAKVFQPKVGPASGVDALTRVREYDDFVNDPELWAWAQAIFAHDDTVQGQVPTPGVTHHRYWAAAMAVRSLHRAGKLTRAARVLVLGAAAAPLLYYLTRYVGEVVAIDNYLGQNAAAPEMVFAPEQLAPYPYESERLKAVHNQGLPIREPDQTFDAIVVLEPASVLDEVGQWTVVLKELQRVVRPDGVVSLTANLLINGPPDRPGTKLELGLITREAIVTQVPQSGLATWLPGSLEPGDRTLAQPRVQPAHGEDRRRHAQFIQVKGGFALADLHLAFVPSGAAVEPHANGIPARRRVVTPILDILLEAATLRHDHRPLQPIAAPAPSAPVVTHSGEYRMADLRHQLNHWNGLRLKGSYNKTLQRLPRPIAAVVRAFVRWAYLGRIQAAEHGVLSTMVDQLDADQAKANALEAQLAQVASQSIQPEVFRGVQLELHRLSEQQLHREEDQRHALDAMREALSNSLLEQVAQLNERIRTLELREVETARALEALHSQLAHQEAFSSSLDKSERELAQLGSALRQTASELRLIQWERRKTTSSSGSTGNPIIATSIVELLKLLERDLPDLGQCRSVEVNVEAPNGESLVHHLAGYYRERLSGWGNAYRHPNDLYVDVRLQPTPNELALDHRLGNRLTADGMVLVAYNTASTIHSDDSLFRRLYVATREDEAGIATTIEVWKKTAKP